MPARDEPKLHLLKSWHECNKENFRLSSAVSCNSLFCYRGSYLCLHVIWVLMNVLQVNGHDKMLHQKTNSAENVSKMLSNCQSNNAARLASTTTGNTSRPPLPGVTQTGSSGMSTATYENYSTFTTARPNTDRIVRNVYAATRTTHARSLSLDTSVPYSRLKIG